MLDKTNFMTREQFLAIRKKLQDEREAATNSIDEKYTADLNRYLDEHCPLKVDSVYEPVSFKGFKKLKRFVVYARDLKVWDEEVLFISVAGWWLDANNVPSVWKQYTVGGDVAFAEVFKLSENQINLPHPEKGL